MKDLTQVSLDLEIEDVETGTSMCCDSSTTLPICTCPIRLTDCCAMVEYDEAR